MRGRRLPVITMAATMLCMGLMASCGHEPHHAPPAPPAGFWQSVSEHTRCEALLPAFCTGRYGFSADNQGQYTVGPSPAGHTATGHITADEFTALNQVAQAVASSDLTQPPACDKTGLVPGARDRVMLMGVDGHAFSIYSAQGVPRSTCYAGGQQNAQRLHIAIHTLMLKYYPSPFP